MARNAIPQHFAEAMNELGSGTDEAYHAAFDAAFVHTNKTMAEWDNKEVETKVSGTTATCAVLQSTTDAAGCKTIRMHVANTGDSRAVLVSEDPDAPGKYIASPLSFDHTPYRRDERDRVRAAGAKVMSRKQLIGEVPVHDDWDCALGEVLDDTGDPPRLWEGENEYPGCAFTRSLGDQVAESVGCIPTPEVSPLTRPRGESVNPTPEVSPLTRPLTRPRR
jgi:cGMP-dependent protein kinase